MEEYLVEPPKICVSRYGRTVYFFDEINAASVSEAIKFIDQIEKENPKKPIEIILNTSGGNCYDGLALYDRIRFSKCNICIIGTGLVASMGFIVYLAGDQRLLMPNCILMNHQISSNPQGKLQDLKLELEEIKRIEAQCLAIMAERTGQAVKVIQKQISKGDDYIQPDRAIKEGIAHKILTLKGTSNASYK